MVLQRWQRSGLMDEEVGRCVGKLTFAVAWSEKASMRLAMEHLLAKYLDILPLFFVPALPIKVEW